ncbi:MAG: SRPBCC family protein [Bdellovibrionales bacterium]|nr:SRPBCC family protein [Bdellovibrionales bacterium]
MAQATLTKTLEVPKEKLYAAITRYEEYPQFVTGCKKVEVERKAPGQARAKYFTNILGKDLWYTLEHSEDEGAGKVTWKLLESDLLKVDNGTWTLKDLGGGKTEVTYAIEIEFKIWIPGPVLKTLTATSLPMVIAEMEKRAKGAA